MIKKQWIENGISDEKESYDSNKIIEQKTEKVLTDIMRLVISKNLNAEIWFKAQTDILFIYTLI